MENKGIYKTVKELWEFWLLQFFAGNSFCKKTIDKPATKIIGKSSESHSISRSTFLVMCPFRVENIQRIQFFLSSTETIEKLAIEIVQKTCVALFALGAGTFSIDRGEKQVFLV